MSSFLPQSDSDGSPAEAAIAGVLVLVVGLAVWYLTTRRAPDWEFDEERGASKEKLLPAVQE